MKTCKKCGEEKPLDEFPRRRLRSGEWALRGECKTCRSAYHKRNHADNRDDRLEKMSKRYYDNPDRFEDSQQYYQDHKESCQATARTSYAKNPQRSIEYTRQYRIDHEDEIKASLKENSGQRNFYTANYKAAKLQATPRWANLKNMACWYRIAQRMTELTGVAYHIDHVIPLQGKLVSGLHVETNFAMITASANSQKSNSYTPC